MEDASTIPAELGLEIPVHILCQVLSHSTQLKSWELTHEYNFTAQLRIKWENFVNYFQTLCNLTLRLFLHSHADIMFLLSDRSLKMGRSGGRH